VVQGAGLILRRRPPCSEARSPSPSSSATGASGAQRVQAQWWTATAERKAELRALWPELANAIVDLDVLLELPVVQSEERHAFGRIPGRPGGDA
jgi:hypothetical protein